MLSTLVARLQQHRERLFVASVATFALGVVLLLVSELLPLHEIRVPVATLISLGGIGAGIDIGLSAPGRLRVPTFLRTWRGVIATIAAVLAVAPVLVVLLIALVGVVGDADMDRSGFALALGALIVLAMAALTVLLAIQSVQAILRASKQTPADGLSAEARDAADSAGAGHGRGGH